jgi:hypothetical protein
MTDQSPSRSHPRVDACLRNAPKHILAQPGQQILVTPAPQLLDLAKQLEAELEDARKLIGELSARSETATPSPDPLTLELADALFGCFLDRAPSEADHTYDCAVCEEPVSMPGWVVSKHAEGCAVAKARDYLAQHAPHRTPGYVRPDRQGAEQ